MMYRNKTKQPNTMKAANGMGDYFFISSLYESIFSF